MENDVQMTKKTVVVEVGYANTVKVDLSNLIDYSLTMVHSTGIDAAGDSLTDDDTSLVLTISKSFDLK